MASQESKELTSDWPAIAVQHVIESSLDSIIESDALWRSLPVHQVNPQEHPSSEVAVVSWKWDTDNNQPSENILSVIRYAKQENIQYLFLDVISIDQTRKSDKIIEQVLDFSRLYKTIPVIAAYEWGGEFTKTMRRPWIAHEVLTFANNPHHVTYISHKKQGEGKFGFIHMVDMIWRTGYIHSIIGVLAGSFEMSQISDFRFLLPAFSKTLEVAYSRMSRNDYLLTAAILSSDTDGRQNLYNIGVISLPYHIFEIKENPDVPSSSWTFHDVSLNKVKIATWKYKYNDYLDTESFYFETEPRAKQSIVEFLGLTVSEDTNITIDDRRRASTSTGIKGIGRPELKVYSMVRSGKRGWRFKVKDINNQVTG